VTAQPGKSGSRTEVVNCFSSPEELLHTADADDGRLRVAAACAQGRCVADQYRGSSVSQLAASLRVKVTLDSWTAYPGGVLYFAESDTCARTVVVNCWPLRRIALFLEEFTDLGRWRREERIQEVVLAHEMYHLVTGRLTRRATEIEAHAFARSLLDLPFSPTLFEWAARRAQGGVSARNNVHLGTTVKD
jgi:hypothetical protein